jgi:hypothetical protein
MKILRVVLTGEEYPHYTITNAFKKVFDDIFNKKQLKHIEDYSAPVAEDSKVDWELDEFYSKHFQELGLTDSPNDDGSEYISRL